MVCLFCWLVGGGIGWVGGFFFVFVCSFVYLFVCLLFVYCLFVRYLLQTLEPTGFKATFSEDRSKNPVLKLGFFFVLFFFPWQVWGSQFYAWVTTKLHYEY